MASFKIADRGSASPEPIQTAKLPKVNQSPLLEEAKEADSEGYEESEESGYLSRDDLEEEGDRHAAKDKKTM